MCIKWFDGAVRLRALLLEYTIITLLKFTYMQMQMVFMLAYWGWQVKKIDCHLFQIRVV